MGLTKEEMEFIERRIKLTRSWPFVGSGSLVLILIIAVWMWFYRPLFVNPWAAFEAIKSNSIAESTTLTMAAMLPLFVLGCLIAVVACLLFCFSAFSNERKYIEIIRRNN